MKLADPHSLFSHRKQEKNALRGKQVSQEHARIPTGPDYPSVNLFIILDEEMHEIEEMFVCKKFSHLIILNIIRNVKCSLNFNKL